MATLNWTGKKIKLSSNKQTVNRMNGRRQTKILIEAITPVITIGW